MEIIHENQDFWKNYMIHWFGEDLIDEWQQHAEITTIESIKGAINIEVYRGGDVMSPTLVFSHGIAGYARLLLPFIMPLVKKGYNIIAPDLEGFGYNNRRKGDFCWDEHMANLHDTVAFARKEFQGPVYLGGGSMGGPLAFATDARFNCADGLVCWCLWDFADRTFIEETGTFGKMTFHLLPILKYLSLLFGSIAFKTTRFVSYHSLTEDPVFNAMLMKDPHAGKSITLRGALSLLIESKPDIEHAEYKKPILVCNPEKDEMTKPIYTKIVFEKLQTKHKEYAGFEVAHFPLDHETYIHWGDCVDRFLKCAQSGYQSSMD